MKTRKIFFVLISLLILGLVIAQSDDQDNKDGVPQNGDSNGNSDGQGQQKQDKPDTDGKNSDGQDDDDDDDNEGDDKNDGNQDNNGDNNGGDPNKEPSNSDLKEIKIGEYYKINKTLVYNNGYQPAGFFYFTINEKIPQRDLVIMVRGRQDFTHNPALFYSQVNKHPDLSSPSDVNCGLTGHDFCIIPDEKISKNQTYYLGIHCIKTCQFEIYVQYDPLFNQPLNSQVIYESLKDYPYVLDIQVVLPSNLDDNIEHILIESYILNFNQVSTNFNMYVNKGTTRPTSSSYDYITEELKLNGQSVLLEKSVDKFVPGQVYSVAIEVPSKAKMLVRSESFEKVRTIYFFKSVDDMVKKGQIRFFKLEISVFTGFEWDKEELSIDLEPYFGNADLYVNHNSLPDDPTNLSSYKWSSTEQDGLESLTITKGSIDNKSMTGEVFYIAVYGESAASFRLLGYSSSIDQRLLTFNCVEVGYTIQNEIVNYQLPLQEQQADTNVTLKLSTIQGDAQLFLKRCINATKIEDCQITQSDINNKQLAQPNFYRSVEISKNHKIDFAYNKNDCTGSNGVNKCIHVVGVQGLFKGQNKYRLLAKHTIQPIQLRENEDHRYFLLEGEKEFYKFTISQEDETMHKVEFNIVTISGELIVYSSRKNPFPDSKDNEKAELALQDVISYHRSNKNPSLKGSYYISIQAVQGCIYQIHVKIYHKKNDGTIVANMKQIELGNVEKGYLSYLSPHQYYFVVDPQDQSSTHQNNIALFFNSFKNETIPTVRIDPQIQIFYQVNKTTFLNVTRVQQDFISSDFILIKIYTNHTGNGKYIVSLSHKDEIHKTAQIRYQLNINANDIMYIEPRDAYIQDLKPKQYQNYELYVNEPAHVYLEVFDCIGKVKVQASSTISNVESQIFDVKSTTPSRFIGDHTIVNYEKNTKGPLFISVSSLSDHLFGNINSLFMIIPHILNQKAVIPHEIFGTPEEGQIKTDVDFRYDQALDQYVSDIKVSFGAIQCANGCLDSAYIPKGYTYLIHITNKDNYMQYFAKCNMDQSILKYLGLNETDIFYRKSFKNYKTESHPELIQEQYSYLPNGTYYVEVMAVLFLETNYTKSLREPFTFIYPMKQFVVGNSTDGGQPQIIEKTEEKYILPLFIMVPIGVALLALILICIYKNIKTFIIRRRYRLAMMMQEKNPDVEVADKEGNINDDDENQKNKKKVDKINFLN
ncbi:transmembrane protein, putative (macronuclear) [Tetrahymena thermophila SB210]|uniref:Transmembrane protein, putative n=1 Tax=Tetrahymena thermophila (strain SB210) TaxID=312017 RepID=I7M441_TETTS|nr:transmembrane protein, putative [Tetrahymena thermophila SB210]EAS04858.1 transmembrane protein, putative [Tetrahymena thermophila SB210]|eukprot:XP_001025103.1 transmembrane protein, putative [Tetrahymena thermophila SB210]